MASTSVAAEKLTGEEALIVKKLFDSTMGGAWNEVIDIYRKHPQIHKAKITRSEDTALHIAVSDGQEETVEELVNEISSQSEKKAKEALRVVNERGNTPLHLAAMLGSVKMCKCIANVDWELIGARNKDSETPFFLAAHNGKKDAFLCLDHFCQVNQKQQQGQDKLGYTYCRRNDGETILHSAIIGDYFDLAFQIINRYEELVNFKNVQGFSPLHLLASKPSVFRSGSRFGRFSQIIYLCTFVDELEVMNIDQSGMEKSNVEKNPKYPENYQTCFNFLQPLWKVICLICKQEKKNIQKTDTESQGGHKDINNLKTVTESKAEGHRHHFFPPNYRSCFETVKLLSKAMIIVLGFGSREITRIENKKQNHTWSVQIMNQLIDLSSTYQYENTGEKPPNSGIDDAGALSPQHTDFRDITTAMSEAVQPLMTTTSTAANSSQASNDDDINYKMKISISDQKWRGVGSLSGEEKKKKNNYLLGKKESPILIAAKNGVTEMVEKILRQFPVAIHDMNSDGKNVLLLAVENRQPQVYQLLLKRDVFKDSVFRKVDKDGNSALHLAAMLGEYRPWLIPGAALQMQWELKWYEFVKTSTTLHFFTRHNKFQQTPKYIFNETHRDLVKSGGEWLTNTSESCSVVAALIATVAFATSSTVPGGIQEDTGTPTFENEPPFDVFAISSLIALCFSVTAVVIFLAILTSRYEAKDFRSDLPNKLLLGLTSLFISIASMLISFCAGHFFVLKDKFKFAAFPIYAVTCLPVTLFAIAQFPLYFDLMRATFRKVPQRSYRVISSN